MTTGTYPSDYTSSEKSVANKNKLNKLLELRKIHGYNVPNLDGYEQFGSKTGSDALKLFIKPTEAKDFRLLRLNDYKSTYANTRKYNKETKKYDLFDTRTNKVFSKKDAYDYINLKNSEAAKFHYKTIYGTETPQKDIEYLQQFFKVEKESKKDFLTINKAFAEKYGSKTLEGEGITVADKKEQLRIIKLNEALQDKKKGTSFEKTENAQLEYKINQAVKNKDDQPLNLKDVRGVTIENSTLPSHVKEQLMIDKKFNTYDGVTY